MIAVEVKGSGSSPLSSRQVASIVDRVRLCRNASFGFAEGKRIGLLLVSGSSLLVSAQASLAEDPYAAWVMVRGRQDEDDLLSAMNGLLSDLES
jgi:hypothetical protein